MNQIAKNCATVTSKCKRRREKHNSILNERSSPSKKLKNKPKKSTKLKSAPLPMKNAKASPLLRRKSSCKKPRNAWKNWATSTCLPLRSEEHTSELQSQFHL